MATESMKNETEAKHDFVDQRDAPETLRSPLMKKSLNKRKHLVSAALPSAEFTTCAVINPQRGWVYASVACNVFLLLALLCREWRWSTEFGSSNTSSANGVSETGALCVVTDAVRSETIRECSGHGYAEIQEGSGDVRCRCHQCYIGTDCSEKDLHCTIDLDHGDPTVFEDYWLTNGDSSLTTILGWQRMSYFANSRVFWFVQKELDQVLRSLHKVVGNADTEGRYIVIGTGSTQLFQAALYALSSPSRSTPTKVVSAAPYYSSHPLVTDFIKSELFRWAGDANEFEQLSEDDAYIEVVTSPNNPDGEMRQSVVAGNGHIVHDLAYYWPHFTPITGAADHDLMLFTVSKSTGHAGTRIGWAIVKDIDVAKKMTKFIELNTIGVSKDSQIRATNILRSVVKQYTELGHRPYAANNAGSGQLPHRIQGQTFFHYGFAEMSYRWKRLRLVVSQGLLFSLPELPSSHCNFYGEVTTPTPAFAWLRCNLEDNCASFLKANGIITRGGPFFGADDKYVRLSMLDRRTSFEIMVDRLASMQSARS